jgi:hypothetical protein
MHWNLISAANSCMLLIVPLLGSISSGLGYLYKVRTLAPFILSNLLRFLVFSCILSSVIISVNILIYDYVKTQHQGDVSHPSGLLPDLYCSHRANSPLITFHFSRSYQIASPAIIACSSHSAWRENWLWGDRQAMGRRWAGNVYWVL